jgi:hypothetical protein
MNRIVYARGFRGRLEKGGGRGKQSFFEFIFI